MQGEVEFRSILYVPAIPPMGKDDIVNPKTKNIRLYVKRVFISDDFDGELVNIMAKVRTIEESSIFKILECLWCQSFSSFALTVPTIFKLCQRCCGLK